MNGVTFDAGGLIALDRNDRQVLALIARTAVRKMRITIPATALAQVIHIVQRTEDDVNRLGLHRVAWLERRDQVGGLGLRLEGRFRTADNVSGR